MFVYMGLCPIHGAIKHIPMCSHITAANTVTVQKHYMDWCVQMLWLIIARLFLSIIKLHADKFLEGHILPEHDQDD